MVNCWPVAGSELPAAGSDQWQIDARNCPSLAILNPRMIDDGRFVEMKERADTIAQFSALEEAGQHMQTDAVIFRLSDLRARMMWKAD